MAIQTRRVGNFFEYLNGDDQPATGEFRVEYDYDDALNNRLMVARAFNTTSRPGSVELVRTSDGRHYGPFTIQGNLTQPVEQTISTNQQNRLNLTVRPDGRLDGCDVNLRWPA